MVRNDLANAGFLFRGKGSCGHRQRGNGIRRNRVRQQECQSNFMAGHVGSPAMSKRQVGSDKKVPSFAVNHPDDALISNYIFNIAHGAPRSFPAVVVNAPEQRYVCCGFPLGIHF